MYMETFAHLQHLAWCPMYHMVEGTSELWLRYGANDTPLEFLLKHGWVRADSGDLTGQTALPRELLSRLVSVVGDAIWLDRLRFP